MAVETNGLYGNQYGQPAELAASTPSVPTHNSSASVASNATSQTGAAKADPQEIGWYFVEQFYSTLSKSPEKIHLFYSKKSQLVTGVEAEKVVPAVGTKAISEKIKAMDIQDCKVRVLNVDSQASFQNIVVQVIGEMSTRSEPHHKFVQTFVLAEQPNGYFVLNDILRYLNNDEDEIVEDELAQEETTQEEHSSPVEQVVGIKEPEEITAEKSAEEVDAKLEEFREAEHMEKDVESPSIHETLTEPIDEEVVPPEHPAEITTDLTEETPAAASTQEQPAEAESAAVQSPPKATTPAPVAEAPPTRKTWASMVGTKAPAVPALPATTTPAPSQPKAQRSAQPPQTPKAALTEPIAAAEDITSPNQTNGWQAVDSGKKQNRPGAKAVPEQITLAYIKNVNDKVDARILRDVLEKYGELKYFDVSRPRNCAFVEFADPAGYNAAVAANPHDIGGELINVEERRPRPNAFGGSNAGFGRGSSSTGRGRGSSGLGPRSDSRGGGFPKDATRGNFQQRGTKTGNITPRGRGQGPAA